MPFNINARTSKASPEFLRTWGNPEQQADLTQDDRAYRYRRLWDLYQGTAFDSVSAWSRYRRQFGLYRSVRQVWDHAHQLVEFYATHIYSGTLPLDGMTLPDGVENAVPIAPNTDPTLAKALGQLWAWWNWQEQMTLVVRYTAALGEMLVELVDDPARGKVLINLVWPAYVKDLTLDESGNVIEYQIEYKVYEDTTGLTFVYRRKVTKDYIETFKDDQPFDYGRNPLPVGTQPYGEYVSFGADLDWQPASGARIENPYGFVPAVWFRHNRTLGVRGEPAIWATQAQLDEANQLFSHLLDKAHVSLEAPIVVAGNIAPNALQRAMNQMVGSVKRAFTEDFEHGQHNDRESLNILEGPAGTRVETIELKISEAAEALDRIVASIEKKCPELTFYQQLRNMTQITGPAAQRILGDVDRKVRSVAAGYDRSLVRLMQMGISICAMRLDEGLEGWADPNEEQLKFASFDDESYHRGELDFTIMPRSIVAMNSRDKLELLTMKKNVFGEWLPMRVYAEELGYKTQDIERWDSEYSEPHDQPDESAVELPPKPTGAPPDGPQQGAMRQQRRDAVSATERVG